MEHTAPQKLLEPDSMFSKKERVFGGAGGRDKAPSMAMGSTAAPQAPLFLEASGHEKVMVEEADDMVKQFVDATRELQRALKEVASGLREKKRK